MGKVDDMRKQRELLFAQRERAIRAREAAETDKPSGAAVKEASSRAAVREAPEASDKAAADESPTPTTKLGKKIAKPAAKPAKPSKIPTRAKGKAAEPEEPADDEPKKSTAAKPAGKRTGKSAGKDEVGTCSVCRKPKPLQNGVVASHQKGLGKACAGSRKPPL